MSRKTRPYLFHRVAACQSGYGHHSHVKQSAEECGKKHDLGKNKPAHAPAKGQINLPVIFSTLALTDYGAEPPNHHVNNGGHASDNDPRTRSNSVHPKYAAERKQE